MKKISIVLFFAICVCALKTSAQTSKDSIPVFSIGDSASFTGKYKYEGLPFQYMEISVKDGNLFYSGGEYNGSLVPLKDKKDAFDSNGQATFTFLRNNENKVDRLKIDYNGQSYLGNREEKKN